MRLRCTGELLINGMRIGGTFLLRQQLLGCRRISSFTRFDEYLTQRREQASKSLLIQVPSADGAAEVKDYLQSRYGKLESLYYYTLPKKAKGNMGGGGGGVGGTALSYLANHASQRDHHWLLAEFSSKQSALDCISSCQHGEGTLPFQSSMLFYQGLLSNGNGASGSKSRRNNSSGGAIKSKENSSAEEEEGPEMQTERLTNEVPTPNFKKGKTLSDQLKILEESTKLSELGIRVRFFVASQLEQVLSNLFPNGCILPFGSTVSGIGRQSGDLDLVMVPDTREIFPDQQQNLKASSSSNGKLLFHSKILSFQNTANARYQTQKVMEIMGDVIQLFIPGCVHLQRILQARVPILRFGSDFTDLQCDLSMTNSSGLHMSELIYLMTKLEPRFSTLLFAIRAWASARKITNPIPGRQPTNFMFVLLLIYFLQQKQLLPTLDILFNNAAAKDQRITADGIDCTFIRNRDQILRHFTPRTDPPQSLAELLFDFFEFYSEFDFNSKGVSLITGNSWGKPDAGPLYIQNPLERHLNVARNVSKEEVSRFKSECCSALWKLETSWNAVHNQHQQSSSVENRGLLVTLKELLLTPTLDGHHTQQRVASTEQRLQMKELFTK